MVTREVSMAQDVIPAAQDEIVASEDEVIPPDFTSTLTLPKLGSSKSPRHIFIFLDGTWNEERTSRGLATPTNVLRMFQETKHKTSDEITSSSNQGSSPVIIAHYHRGVGNRQDNNKADRMWNGFNGKDEKRIRNAAFAGLYRDYKNNNDRIYIVGFSRGAASARLLARDICIKGLPPKLKVHTTYFPNLLTGQIEARVDSVERVDEGQNPTNYCPKITFLGCWDTVGAFVLPARWPRRSLIDKTIHMFKSSVPRAFHQEGFREDENEIPKSVQKAVHCVAIDETRNAFLPTLMPHGSNIEEVWFPGVHSDVGGGYDDNMLADGPYEFMKRRLVDSTDLMNEDLFKIRERQGASSKASDEVLFKAKETQSASTGSCFHFHGLSMSRAKKFFGFGTAIRRIRVLDKKDAKPKIHDSLYHIMNSNSVFAADPRNRRTWTITYDPYNVKQLKQQFDIVYD